MMLSKGALDILSPDPFQRSPFLLKQCSQLLQRRRARICFELVVDILLVITTGLAFTNRGGLAPAHKAAGKKWLFSNFRVCKTKLALLNGSVHFKNRRML
jgi:hypothetical protein